jgi:hypothetical protein
MKYIYLCLIFIVIIIISCFKSYEYFIENDLIIFLDRESAYNVLINSGYLNKLNSLNMKLRKCNNLNDCKRHYRKNIINYTEKEKNILRRMIIKCDEKLKIFPKLHKIEWKFAKINNNLEEGLPHTHLDTIFLSDKFFNNPSIDTLIHEKIHLYQKKYPYKTDSFYNLNNYEKTQKIDIINRRANPDTNNFDYKKNGVITYSIFNENPKSLSDIKLHNDSNNPHINEHPDEYFAYLITKKIMNKFNENDGEIINYISY